MGDGIKYSGEKLGVFENNNNNRCIGRQTIFTQPASFGEVYAVILGDNETSSDCVTADIETRYIYRLPALGYHKELIISVWKDLECWSSGTCVFHIVNIRQKDVGNNHPYQRNMVQKVHEGEQKLNRKYIDKTFDLLVEALRAVLEYL